MRGPPRLARTRCRPLPSGGTPTAGTFKLVFDGWTTAAITWSATNATLLANINAALDALPNVGTSGIVATAGTLTAGIGTILLTFSGGSLTKRAVPTMAAISSLTGTSPTLAIAETTPGVNASGLGAAKGSLLTDVTNGILYINTGSAVSPTWTKVGTQT